MKISTGFLFNRLFSARKPGKIMVSVSLSIIAIKSLQLLKRLNTKQAILSKVFLASFSSSSLIS